MKAFMFKQNLRVQRIDLVEESAFIHPECLLRQPTMQIRKGYRIEVVLLNGTFLKWDKSRSTCGTFVGESFSVYYTVPILPTEDYGFVSAHGLRVNLQPRTLKESKVMDGSLDVNLIIFISGSEIEGPSLIDLVQLPSQN
ncbi:hypothetical protein TNIN_224751 [Trichonephila inaurata madagascariensis]|uniref:Uncharacterized protein n=1 Tax=Trichonephila inaurata madagascariensis TaxID=2747483 RepID=A0A8X6YIG7_9ARAC|nr:hypothetical protein TNIN_224751 [Trichonephila inaurata madagascariensis]